MISTINAEWAKFDWGELKDNNYRTALFVALLKLGQESTIRDSGRSNSPILQGFPQISTTLAATAARSGIAMTTSATFPGVSAKATGLPRSSPKH